MRLAILSDIHGNADALHAVLADATRQRVDALYSLGDNVGYGPEPEEVLIDRVNGLVWQRSGSPYPLTWPLAQRYAAGLASRQLAGFAGWRLPTAAERIWACRLRH